jgi:hypothetical protein
MKLRTFSYQFLTGTTVLVSGMLMHWSAGGNAMLNVLKASLENHGRKGGSLNTLCTAMYFSGKHIHLNANAWTFRNIQSGLELVYGG